MKLRYTIGLRLAMVFGGFQIIDGLGNLASAPTILQQMASIMLIGFGFLTIAVVVGAWAICDALQPLQPVVTPTPVQPYPLVNPEGGIMVGGKVLS